MAPTKQDKRCQGSSAHDQQHARNGNLAHHEQGNYQNHKDSDPDQKDGQQEVEGAGDMFVVAALQAVAPLQEEAGLPQCRSDAFHGPSPRGHH
jgi:hypothetical protein